MINVSSKALNNLCKAYQIKDSDLTFLGGGREDSDGIAYFYYFEGQKKVLNLLILMLQTVISFYMISLYRFKAFCLICQAVCLIMYITKNL